MQVFVERQPRDLLLTDAGPGTILGELAVVCGIPRSASVRASEKSAILQWSAPSFAAYLLRNAFLSERIFRESLRTLIEKEQSLIDSLIRSQAALHQNRFPWDRKNVYDLTSVPVSPFWTWVALSTSSAVGQRGSSSRADTARVAFCSTRLSTAVGTGSEWIATKLRSEHSRS